MDDSHRFILPDLFAICPFSHSFNPHFERAAAESSAWIDSFHVFRDRKRAFFMQSNAELLAGFVYPYAGYEELRTCCDFINVLFVMDEISDDQDGDGARTTMGKHLTVLRELQGDDSAISRMSREFKMRFDKRAGARCRHRFAELCEKYIAAVVREADLRARGQVLGVEEYRLLRRCNSAVDYCFGLFEYILGVDLPDEVMNHPVLRCMRDSAVDMICWSNDAYSYNMEQAKGHTGNNIVTVLMKEKELTLQGAFDYVGQEFQRLIDSFLTSELNVPSWGTGIDTTVGLYISAMRFWVVGNLHWSFESQRYFGSKGAEIQKTLSVSLLNYDPEAYTC